MPSVETEKKHGPKIGRSMAYGSLSYPYGFHRGIRLQRHDMEYLLFNNLRTHEWIALRVALSVISAVPEVPPFV